MRLQLKAIAAAALMSVALAPVSIAYAAPEVWVTSNRGAVTYIDFWASWCTPCAQSFPWLNQMQARYGDKGLHVVGVGIDAEAANAQRFLKVHPATFEIVLDAQGKFAEQYAIEGMPYSVILDVNGKVVHRHSGFRSSDVDAYEQAIKKALADNGAGK